MQIRELRREILFQVTECVSHLPAYLPKQACNMVSPSLLRTLDPGCQKQPGFFFAQIDTPGSHRYARIQTVGPTVLVSEQPLQRFPSGVDSLAIERGKELHGGAIGHLFLHTQQRRGRLAAL